MPASAPPSLRDVQRWLKARIRPSAPPSRVAVALNPQGGDAGEARLAVYAEGYLARIREALAETYDAVHHLVGASAFRALAADYAARSPSQDYNLSRTARALPELLADHPLTRRLPFLPDLARLERALSVAFHAPHREPITLQQVTAYSLDAWAGRRLLFHPSVQLIESAWPIVDLWQARQTPREQIDLAVTHRPQSALVSRPSSIVHCELVDPMQAAVLRRLLDGCAVSQACEGRSRRDVEVAEVTQWYADWMARGWIVGCEPIERRS